MSMKRETKSEIKKSKKIKKELKNFSLSGPTNFIQGFHASRDAETGRINGLNEKDSLPAILRLRQADDEESKVSQKKKEEELRKRKKEEEVRRKEEEKEDQRRKKKEECKLDITGPLHVEHKLHVDENLNWTDADSLQLQSKLGEGAYGVVYRALHIPTNTELAIKIVPISEESAASHDIRKEIDILKLCRHDNVVSLYGCVFTKDSLWIIMEYCGAGSVKDFMKQWPRPFSEEEIAAVLYNVLQGLHYLHSIKIIHRDLKSANILLTNTGNVKIADFGVSFQVNNTLAKANSVVGTPLFMAPEALDVGDYTEKADIWSLAITAIEMQDGVPPYNEEHIMRAMLMITKHDPPTVKDPSSISEGFRNFLSRCLRKNAEERPSAIELMDDEFFNNREDRETTLKKMLAEYKVLKLQSEREKKQEQHAQELESLQRSLAHVDESPRVFPISPRDPTPPTFSRNRSSDSSGGKRKSTKSPSIPEQKFPGVPSPDVQEAIAGLMELKSQLQYQLDMEKLVVEDFDYYSSMSFRQIIEEISEMGSQIESLEKKIARYKSE